VKWLLALTVLLGLTMIHHPLPEEAPPAPEEPRMEWEPAVQCHGFRGPLNYPEWCHQRDA
jgi:hypothetical protein